MLKISRKSSSLRIQESFQTQSPVWTQLFQRNCRSKSLRLIALFGKSLFVKAGLKLLSNLFNHVIVTSGSSRAVASWSIGNKLVRGIQVAGIDRTPFIVFFLFHFISSADCYIAFLQRYLDIILILLRPLSRAQASSVSGFSTMISGSILIGCWLQRRPTTRILNGSKPACDKLENSCKIALA